MEFLISRTEREAPVEGLMTAIWRGLSEDGDPCVLYVAHTIGVDDTDEDLVLLGPAFATVRFGRRLWVWRGETTAHDECLVYVARIEMAPAVSDEADLATCVPTTLELAKRRN